MKDSFQRFSSWSAIIVGGLSILYAVYFLLVSKAPDDSGRLNSWLILAASGIFGSAAYVALYQRVRGVSEGYALWGLLLGLAGSAMIVTNGMYQALLIYNLQNGQVAKSAFDAALQVGQPADPKGVWTFFIFAIILLVFGRLILNGASLPRNLGYVAYLNAILLVLLFIGNVFGIPLLIYIPGGLTSVIVTPLWWIWLGRELGKTQEVVPQ
jgi:hypothetical protein